MLGQVPEADVSVSIVWINILETDSELAARQAAEEFAQDPRVSHFHDAEGRVGRAIARSLGAGAGKVAWDIYLFYERGSVWAEDPPVPVAWMHQLEESRWADPARLHCGEDLVWELDRTLKRLIDCGGV